jgi:hypothetical protein
VRWELRIRVCCPLHFPRPDIRDSEFVEQKIEIKFQAKQLLRLNPILPLLDTSNTAAQDGHKDQGSFYLHRPGVLS